MSEETLPAATPTPEEAPSVSHAAETAATEPPAPEQPFELGSWKGLPRWQCRRCPWDTLVSEEAFWEHFYQWHTPPAPTPAPRRASPLVDRFGNRIGG